MDLVVKSTLPEKTKAGILAVPVFSEPALTDQAKQIDDLTGNVITRCLDLGECKTSAGSAALIAPVGNLKTPRLIVFGLGKQGATTPENFRNAISKVISLAKSTQAKDLAIALDGVQVIDRDHAWQARQIGETAAAQCYTFNHYKSKSNKKPVKLSKIALLITDKGNKKITQSGAKIANAVAKGMDYTRDLGNLPGNVCHPSYLAKEAQKLAKASPKLSVKIIDEKEMKSLGMGALLSVSAGSKQPAKLIIMEYKGGKQNERPHVIVGKGITFDSGGISLKPGAGMDQMKFDMCGAASVFGTMKTIVKLEPAANIIGVVTAAENMPGGKATRPGDIVKTMSGQTVEILNTDAEGRLVLCDALTYVEKYKPASVIDEATLTGAVLVALGTHGSAVIGNNDEVIENIKASAEFTGDKTWQLPMWDEHHKQLESPYADLANIGGRNAGTITAACFLSKFTHKYPWAHLDIAGIAWYTGGPMKGATGRPVPLLTDYLLRKTAS
ncbi:MAG: leucyl aminopeptidase [Gammaproteobacteria bacterium]|nr:MAG: leucyl aminopeptidase [Gammaproteobacteria bacterium]